MGQRAGGVLWRGAATRPFPRASRKADVPLKAARQACHIKGCKEQPRVSLTDRP